MIVGLIALLLMGAATAGLGHSYSKDDRRYRESHQWDKTTVLRHYPNGRIKQEEY